jgi:hypothetical protein
MSLWYVVCLNTYLDRVSYLKDTKFWFRLQVESYISDWRFSKLQHLAMFPTIMPWPMTLAPTNEAVRRENHAEKNLYKEKN